jgi:hypothetical protein
MIRLAYRAVIALHPPNFRDRHGDEMVCIFDESGTREARNLLADGVISLARQWLLHSGAWKLAAGFGVSSILLLGWAYGINSSFDWSMRWAAERTAKLDRPVPPLNRLEFQRESAQAVAMLERFHQLDGKRSGSSHTPARQH